MEKLIFTSVYLVKIHVYVWNAVENKIYRDMAGE